MVAFCNIEKKIWLALLRSWDKADESVLGREAQLFLKTELDITNPINMFPLFFFSDFFFLYSTFH